MDSEVSDTNSQSASGLREKFEDKASGDSSLAVFGSPPIGSVVAFAGLVSAELEEQEGWMLCNGRPLRRALYPDLWTVLQTIYGTGLDEQGTQVGDFNLPDYRGHFLRGVDNHSGNDPDAGRRQSHIDQAYMTGDVVGSRQPSALGQHLHSAVGTLVAGEPLSVMRKNAQPPPELQQGLAAGGMFGDNNQNGISRRQRGVTVTVGVTGESETRPINTSVNWLIKFKQ